MEVGKFQDSRYIIACAGLLVYYSRSGIGYFKNLLKIGVGPAYDMDKSLFLIHCQAKHLTISDIFV